jgi:hypothetical protein
VQQLQPHHIGKIQLNSKPIQEKILEIVFGFIALIIHRYGDYGKMIFFGTTNNKLQQNDDAIDAENLGNGVLVAYIVISSVLLVAYVIDGRYTIQSFFLEWVWNLVGFFLYGGAGVVALITWSNANNDPTSLVDSDKGKNFDAALTMGALCVLNSLWYLIDTIVAHQARKRFLQDQY